MQKSGSFIALLLIVAIIFLPSPNTLPIERTSSVSPQAVCGDTETQSATLPQDDNESDMSKIIAIVMIIIIVIIIFEGIANTETG